MRTHTSSASLSAFPFSFHSRALLFPSLSLTHSESPLRASCFGATTGSIMRLLPPSHWVPVVPIHSLSPSVYADVHNKDSSAVLLPFSLLLLFFKDIFFSKY